MPRASPNPRRWTRTALIAELRRRVRRGEPIATDRRFYSALYRHFGSLRVAGELAGVRVRTFKRRTRDETVRELKELAARHGTPTNALLEQYSLRRAVSRHFGSLSNACQAAGIESTRSRSEAAHGVHDNDDELLGALRKRAKRLGRPILASDLPWTTHDTLVRRFGSLAAARTAARLPQPSRPPKWTIDSVVAAIRAEHARGTRITDAALRAAGRSDLAEAIRSTVGSFPRARARARVENPPLERDSPLFVQLWDRERVIEEIRKRRSDGEPLAPSKVPRPLVAAANRYCGSWREAITRAGLRYEDVVLARMYSDAELLAELRGLAARYPKMTLKQLRQRRLGPLLHVRFGSAENAAARAGLKDWPIRLARRTMDRKATRAALLERLARGQPITRFEVCRDDHWLGNSVLKIHPQWREALARLRVRWPDVKRGQSRRRR